MTRPLATLCLAGTVLCAASAIAQAPVVSGSKAPVRVSPAPCRPRVPVRLTLRCRLPCSTGWRAELAAEQGVTAGDVKVISAQS